MPQKVIARGETGIMAALVSPGMRAVSMEISVESASGGFILPEDRVDVILTHEVEITTRDGIIDQIQSQILIENAKVLAIDQGTDTEEGDATSIGSTATLELNAEDAALVALGARKGVLSLTLRSLTDAALYGDEVISHGDNLSANAQAGSQVAIFRNGRLSQVNSGGGE